MFLNIEFAQRISWAENGRINDFYMLEKVQMTLKI